MLKNILIVKTTSMGDVIHTLPAIEDLVKHHPDVKIHWIVEAPFAEIVRWHPNVTRAIPVRLRHWRKNLFKKDTWTAWHAFKKDVRTVKYDAIIDCQGLIKSAVLARIGEGERHGFDRTCIRETAAARLYHRCHTVDRDAHAITRTRQLFANIFDYTLTQCDYGLSADLFAKPDIKQPYLIFLHGTTWETKHWPANYWRQLSSMASEAGLSVQLLWGNAKEKQNAHAIAKVADNIQVQDRLTLTQAAGFIAHAQGIVAVDTGLGHLAAALGTPTISLYGPTNPARTGTIGDNQQHLTAQKPACAPCYGRECTYQGSSAETPACFATITPTMVWQKLKTYLKIENKNATHAKN